jgi:hypothetical protein
MKEFLLGAIDVLSALLTPTIGVVATYIAYQQYCLNRVSKKHELLDRRLIIFKACMSFLARSVQQSPNQDISLQFLRETSDSFYLFKDEIPKYLNEVYEKGIDFEYCAKMLNDPNLPVGERRNKLADKHLVLQTWFSQQFTVAREIFKPYLEVG